MKRLLALTLGALILNAGAPAQADPAYVVPGIPPYVVTPYGYPYGTGFYPGAQPSVYPYATPYAYPYAYPYTYPGSTYNGSPGSYANQPGYVYPNQKAARDADKILRDAQRAYPPNR